MKRSLILLSAALAMILAAGVIGIQGSRAQEQEEYVSKAKATKLLQTTLAGIEGKEVNIVHLSAPPGFVGGKHSHSGHVFVYILEGQFTVEMKGEAPRTLGPGDVFQEPVGNVMQARNLSSTHGVKLVIFQVGDQGKPLTVKAE